MDRLADLNTRFCKNIVLYPKTKAQDCVPG